MRETKSPKGAMCERISSVIESPSSCDRVFGPKFGNQTRTSCPTVFSLLRPIVGALEFENGATFLSQLQQKEVQLTCMDMYHHLFPGIFGPTWSNETTDHAWGLDHQTISQRQGIADGGKRQVPRGEQQSPRRNAVAG